jgi:hypothetical protein
MKRIWHFLRHFHTCAVASLIFFALSPAFADSRCPKPEKPAKLNIKTTPAKVIYKTGHSSSDLTRLQRKLGRHTGKGNWRVLGLTLTDFKYSIKTLARIIPIRGGRYCAEPVSYELEIKYSDFLVYIDRKYPRGSCEYRAILNHENNHVALYRGYLTRYLPTIKRQARNVAASVKPVVVSTPDLGSKYLQNQIQRRIKPLINKLNREANDSNARIDTPKSYRNVQMLCENW